MPIGTSRVVNAEEFYAAFELAFSPGATVAGLIRSRGRALKWTYQNGDAPALAVGFRLNRKNLSSYPGEFMPDISWNGVRSGPTDSGDVSFTNMPCQRRPRKWRPFASGS